MTRRRFAILTLVCSLALLTTSATVARADSGATGSQGGSIVEQIGCDETVTTNGAVDVNRSCQVYDFVSLFIYLSKWGMSILGLLAVMMLVYGGIQFVTAGGRASKVDEGQRIITGTVVGTIIALAAYVIINTAVAAISGTTLNSLNPFGVVATVFGSKDKSITVQGQLKPITKPFSGEEPSSGTNGSSGAVVPDCRADTSDWDRTCSDADGILQIRCADPGPSGGEITNLQVILSKAISDGGKGCNCGSPNEGCYGPQTVSCVRQFQVANSLPPTGVIDATTKGLINGTGLGCDQLDAQNSGVMSHLPTTQLTAGSGTDTGCCVVKNGEFDMYCVDRVSSRACQALGANSTHLAGDCRAAAPQSCGFCSNVARPTRTSSPASLCFQLATPYWCQTVAQNNLTPPPAEVGGGLMFNNGKCDSNCSACINSLLIIPTRP